MDGLAGLLNLLYLQNLAARTEQQLLNGGKG